MIESPAPYGRSQAIDTAMGRDGDGTGKPPVQPAQSQQPTCHLTSQPMSQPAATAASAHGPSARDERSQKSKAKKVLSVINYFVTPPRHLLEST